MLQHSPLGRQVAGPTRYAPELLFAIPREVGRRALGLSQPPPFAGVDIWTAYELSWLDLHGKPQVAVAELRVPADSPALVESKSLKLYLNSLNGSRFADPAAVRAVLARDVGACVGAAIDVALVLRPQFIALTQEPAGTCIDGLPLTVDAYGPDPDPGLLRVAAEVRRETLCSALLRTNCPVTGQPDWADVSIGYAGPAIEPASLLAYLVSFRAHSGYHEQCVEQIFSDLQARCGCTQLSVYARFTRRGGIDINPFRSDFEAAPAVSRRTFRQ